MSNLQHISDISRSEHQIAFKWPDKSIYGLDLIQNRVLGGCTSGEMLAIRANTCSSFPLIALADVCWVLDGIVVLVVAAAMVLVLLAFMVPFGLHFPNPGGNCLAFPLPGQ